MLYQFTFKNFKSFKNEVTINLLASSIKEHPSDVVADLAEEQVLKVAAIYGANASGKSNAIDAFSAMRKFILESFKDNEVDGLQELNAHWFEEKDAPTEFSVLFSTNEHVFQYGFSIVEHDIQEEFLFRRDLSEKKEKYTPLFERVKNDFSGELLKEIELETILKLITNNTLLISVLAQLKLPLIQEVFSWFKNNHPANYGNPKTEINKYMTFSDLKSVDPLVDFLENEQNKKDIEQFIRAVDVGIQGFGIYRTRKKDLLPAYGDIKFAVTYHKIPGRDNYHTVPIWEESSGTQKIISLYMDMKKVLDNGQTLFIDELDARIHPLLLRYILILVHDKKTNPKNAQLIFSTQEVFTLDKENLRRDEIWFVDKDEDGVSDLYSLVDYVDDEDKKVRNDASYGKDYILGRYKSIPSIKKLKA